MSRTLSNLTFRNLDKEHDLPLVVELLKTIQENGEDAGFEVVSEEVVAQASELYGQDPARDVWVVIEHDPAPLVGYGSFFQWGQDPHPVLFIGVHPQWRRLGIGSALLERLLQRARESECKDVDCTANQEHQEVTAFVLRHGFQPISAFTHLSIAADHDFPEPVFPPGFSIRTHAQINDINVFLEANNRGYEGQWSHKQGTLEDVAGWFATIPPEQIYYLFAPDGKLAGVTRGLMNVSASEDARISDQPVGYADAPGVVPEYRSTALYRALLLYGVHSLLPRHPVTIEIESWGDAPETLAMYQELGFHIVRQDVAYRRVL